VLAGSISAVSADPILDRAPAKAGRLVDYVVKSTDDVNTPEQLEKLMSSSRRDLSEIELEVLNEKLEDISFEEYLKTLKAKNTRDEKKVGVIKRKFSQKDEFFRENGKFIDKLIESSPKEKPFKDVSQEELDSLYEKVRVENPGLMQSYTRKAEQAKQDTPFDSHSEESPLAAKLFGAETCQAGDYNCGIESFPVLIPAVQKWTTYHIAPWSDKIRTSTNDECDYRLIFSGPHNWKTVDGYDTSWDWWMVYWPPASFHGVGASGPDGGHIIIGKGRAHATGHTSAYVVRWSVILREN
jgi:hypothetical protein